MDPLTYCLREISLSGTVGLSQEALIESLKASYSSLVSNPTALRNLLQTLAQFLRQHADTPDEYVSVDNFIEIFVYNLVLLSNCHLDCIFLSFVEFLLPMHLIPMAAGKYTGYRIPFYMV